MDQMDARLKQFFQVEQQALAALTPPADFEERMRALVAARLAENGDAQAAPETSDAVSAAEAAAGTGSRLKVLPRLKVSKAKSKRRALALAVAAALLVFAGISAFWPEGPAADDFSGLVKIMPVAVSEQGVDSSQGFLITANEPLDLDFVADNLQVSPQFEYQVQETGDATSYLVLPLEELEFSTIYRLSFDPERALEEQPVRAEYSWAFQTEPALEFVESQPAATAAGVPLTSTLVLSFNKPLAADAAEAVTITPQTQGSWLVSEQQLIFAPSAQDGGGWQAATSYQVEIAETLASASGDSLGHALTLSFTTVDLDEPSGFSFALTEEARLGGAFASSETPAWPVRVLTETVAAEEAAYHLNLYALADVDSYLNALSAYITQDSWLRASEAGRLDSSAYTFLNSWQAAGVADGLGAEIVSLPTQLAPGYYLLELSRAGCLRQLLFQVSDWSGYAALGGRESLFWLHDAWGQPLGGAEVALYQEPGEYLSLGVTDGDGLLICESPQESATPRLFRVTAQGQALVLAAQAEQNLDFSTRVRSSYWYTVALDQELYAPGATLRYFGVLQAQGEALAGNAVATLRLSGGALVGDLALTFPLQPQNGSFTGSIELPLLQDGWYTLDLYLDDLYLCGSYFQIGQVADQAARLTLTPERDWAAVGDTLTWQLEAYYDEQPLSGLSVSVAHPQTGYSQRVVTDETGRAQVVQRLSMLDARAPYLTYTLEAAAALPDGGTLTATGAVQLLQSDTYLETQLERLGQDRYEVSVRAYRLQLNDDGLQYRGYDETLELALALTPWTGLSLENDGEQALLYVGNTGLSHTGELQSRTAYRLELSGLDSQGRAFRQELYLPGWQELWNTTPVLQDSLHFGDDAYRYAVGDAVCLQLYQGQAVLAPEAAGESLFVLAQDGGLTARRAPEHRYEFTYEKPVLSSWLVYYQNGRYYQSESLSLQGEAASAPLQLEITPGQARYAPGETVRLQLRLTDRDGAPVSGLVNLNLIAAEQAAGLQNTLNPPTLSFRHLASHQAAARDALDPLNLAAALPTSGQTLYSVTANPYVSRLFATLVTEADGSAALEFKLPAGERDWCIVWQAYEQGRAVGGSVTIQARADFQLASNISETLLAGDAPVLRLRAGGGALTADDETAARVNYRVSISALEFSGTLSAPAGEWLEVQLPILPEGDYEVQISAESGGLQKRQTLHLSALSSLFQYSYFSSQALAETADLLAQTEGQVTLILSNQQKADTFNELYAVALQQSQRLDQKLASFVAADLLEELTGWQPLNLREDRQTILSAYQQTDGGLSRLPGGASQGVLSALAAPLAGDYLDQAALTRYLRNWYEQSDSDTEQALALYGLGGLGQPVLLDIDQMLEQELSGDARLYLALAQLICGNGMAAREQAAELLSEFTESWDNGQYRASGIGTTDAQEILVATASLAQLANAFNLPQADGLYDYLRSQSNQQLYALELVQILRERSQRLQQPAYFSYTLNDRQYDVNLERYSHYTLNLSQRELAGLDFQGVAGDVVLTVFWQRQGLPELAENAANLQVKRSYEGQSAQITLSANGFTEVRLDYSFAEDTPAGQYTLLDSVPAGFRFWRVDTQQTAENVWFLQEEDNRLCFVIDKPAGGASGTIVYQVRCLTPGSYTAETPFLYYNQGGSLQTLGEGQTVEIK